MRMIQKMFNCLTIIFVTGFLASFLGTGCSGSSQSEKIASQLSSGVTQPLPSPTPTPTSAPGGPTMTWYGACWQYATVYGNTGYFQMMDYKLVTSSPVMVQGTLFAAPNCDVSQSYFGGDNMNDFGTTTNSTHVVQGFAHHPDLKPSSAVYWVGPRTVDGMCPPGVPCSGCVNYNALTPNCDSLP